MQTALPSIRPSLASRTVAVLAEFLVRAKGRWRTPAVRQQRACFYAGTRGMAPCICIHNGKNVNASPTEARLLAGGLKDDLASCQENLQVLWRHWLTPWLAPAGESHLLKEVAQHSCDHRDFPDHQIRPGDDRNRINYTNLERIVCMQGKFLRGLARSHLSTATFFTPRCRPVCQPLMETVSCDSAPGRRHVELFRPARGK